MASGFKQEFAQFLESYYSDEVSEFAENYPTERYLRVSWHSLKEYNADLATRVIEEPRNSLQELEEALRFHTEHDAAYLPNARAIFCDGPKTKHIHELRAEDIGRFTTVAGRITDLEGEKSDL